MQHTRTSAGASALVLLSVLGLTACTSSATELPRSMSSSSEIVNGPTSGIRSPAATPGGGSTPTGTDPTRATAPLTEPSESHSATPAPPTADASDSETASSPAPEPSGTCASTSAEQAVSKNLDKVEPAFPDGDDPGAQWVATDTTTYDPCADLSWVTLSIRGATASSPAQQMLFHDGRYLGTTTRESIAFHPTTVRLSDSVIQVTYRWPRPDESNAAASGRSVSTYSWNPDTESVDHAGEWPPGVG